MGNGCYGGDRKKGDVQITHKEVIQNYRYATQEKYTLVTFFREWQHFVLSHKETHQNPKMMKRSGSQKSVRLSQVPSSGLLQRTAEQSGIPCTFGFPPGQNTQLYVDEIQSKMVRYKKSYENFIFKFTQASQWSQGFIKAHKDAPQHIIEQKRKNLEWKSGYFKEIKLKFIDKLEEAKRNLNDLKQIEGSLQMKLIKEKLVFAEAGMGPQKRKNNLQIYNELFNREVNKFKDMKALTSQVKVTPKTIKATSYISFFFPGTDQSSSNEEISIRERSKKEALQMKGLKREILRMKHNLINMYLLCANVKNPKDTSIDQSMAEENIQQLEKRTAELGLGGQNDKDLSIIDSLESTEKKEEIQKQGLKRTAELGLGGQNDKDLSIIDSLKPTEKKEEIQKQGQHTTKTPLGYHISQFPQKRIFPQKRMFKTSQPSTYSPQNKQFNRLNYSQKPYEKKQVGMISEKPQQPHYPQKAYYNLKNTQKQNTSSIIVKSQEMHKQAWKLYGMQRYSESVKEFERCLQFLESKKNKTKEQKQEMRITFDIWLEKLKEMPSEKGWNRL